MSQECSSDLEFGVRFESASGQSYVLRLLHTHDDYEQCLELQRLTWGHDFRELVPPTILMITQKVGGVLAGAFRGDRLVGFVYGLTGVRDGILAHWSHMLAVRPEEQGAGLGRQLKLFQRDLLRELGVRSMYWTFDPLIARNAALNLRSLGAYPVEYVCDMYGSDTGSELHSGLGTDRFVVRWDFDAGSGEGDRGSRGSWVPSVPPAKPIMRSVPDLSPSLLPLPPADAVETPLGLSAGRCYWIEIPADIGRTKSLDAERARQWRERTRLALSTHLEAGRPCLGLLRVPAADLAGGGTAGGSGSDSGTESQGRGTTDDAGGLVSMDPDGSRLRRALGGRPEGERFFYVFLAQQDSIDNRSRATGAATGPMEVVK